MIASGSAAGPGSLTWLWILIAAVAVVAVVVLALVARRAGGYVGPGTVVVGGWLSLAIEAYEQGLALHAAVSAASRPDAPDSGDPAARWDGIQRRADDLARQLEALRSVAPEVEDRDRVSDALGSLQELRSAIGDEQARGGSDAARAEVIQARLGAFEASLRRLRSPEQHLW